MEIPDIKQYKNQIINITIVVIALIIANHIYKNQMKAAESLKLQQQEVIRVNGLLSQIRLSDAEISAYKKILGAKDISVLINEINSIAKEKQVKVLSIKPLKEAALPSYAKQEFEIAVSAEDSHHIGEFVSGLESSTQVFVIEDFNESAIQQDQEKGAGKEITARITLSAIFIRG